MKYILERLSHQSIGCGSYAYKDTHSRDGQIFLPIDTPNPYALYSKNNGKSWKTLSLETGRKTDRFIQLQDGSFYALSFDNVVHDAIRNYRQQHIPFVAGIYRANTMEDVVAGNISSSFTQIDIPGLCLGWGDSGNCHTSCISNGLIQLSNGNILATMYGQTKEDTTLCPYFQTHGGYDFYLYRSWCILSKDGGNTFSFLSTIADVQTHPIPDVNAEGYCEPDCIELEPGHIVCVIRTGGHEVYSPLY
ncbi:MAG: exo-alpha-sialidase, partial [Clostridiales bacterium]|nr:exo-alpha-sialidase [Clostridiales bacterium]